MVQIMELGQPAVYFHDGADVNITFDEMTGFNIEAGVMNDSADALNDQSAFFGQTMQGFGAEIYDGYGFKRR